MQFINFVSMVFNSGPVSAYNDVKIVGESDR